MKCFYHRQDFDGICSGAIVYNKYPHCEMIGVNYDEPLDFDSIEEDETVFVVDFCFTRDEMIKLGLFSNLVWIDHHKSSIEMMADFPSIRGQREIGVGACELTRNCLYGLETHKPLAVKLLSAYDVWDHTNELTLPFQYGLRAIENTGVKDHIWKILLDKSHEDHEELIKNIIKNGTLILNYQTIQDTMYAKGMAYETVFEGYPAIIMNKPYANSKVFDSVYDPDKHDLMILFGIKEDKFKYTLYSDKPEIDVSAIAKKYGGGGHAGAAGFSSLERIV